MEWDTILYAVLATLFVGAYVLHLVLWQKVGGIRCDFVVQDRVRSTLRLAVYRARQASRDGSDIDIRTSGGVYMRIRRETALKLADWLDEASRGIRA